MLLRWYGGKHLLQLAVKTVLLIGVSRIFRRGVLLLSSHHRRIQDFQEGGAYF